MGDQDATLIPLDGQLDPKRIALLEKQQYRIVGSNKHSAVKVCHWTKASISGKNVCYKQKFYGIDCHRCAEVSPAVMWCNNRCSFCWRTMEYYDPKHMDQHKLDDPRILINGFIEQRRKLINGFKGKPGVDIKKFEESLVPNHWAISLSGEPTLYARLPEMIYIIRTEYKPKSVFLVTNGQNPDMLLRLEKEDGLPTQLYISMNAPNKELYFSVNKPIEKDYWGRYLRSLDIMRTLKGKTRTVLRMTLIKNHNMSNPEQYAELFRRADPDYIEVKAYVHVGYSRKRLNYTNSPTHNEIKLIANEFISCWPELKVIDEKADSRIVLLGKEDKRDRILQNPSEEIRTDI